MATRSDHPPEDAAQTFLLWLRAKVGSKTAGLVGAIISGITGCVVFFGAGAALLDGFERVEFAVHGTPAQVLMSFFAVLGAITGMFTGAVYGSGNSPFELFGKVVAGLMATLAWVLFQAFFGVW